MIKSKAILWCYAAVVVQQLIICYMGANTGGLLFLDGVPIISNFTLHNISMGIWYFPIFFLLYHFSSRATDLLHGYGQLLVIRSYSKSKILLKEIKYILTHTLPIVFFQFIVGVLIHHDLNLLLDVNCYLELIMYYLTVVVIILLQLCLELMISAPVANITCNVYILVSVIIFNLAGSSNLIKYILLPNAAMGVRNGILELSSTYSYQYLMCILIGIGIVCGIYSTWKYNKKDFI